MNNNKVFSHPLSNRMTNNIESRNFFKILFVLLTLSQLSCKKFVQIDPPPTQIISSSVYSNDVTAIAAVKGIYSQMISSSGFASGGLTSITNLSGLSSDEFNNFSFSEDQIRFYTNSLDATNSTIQSSLWEEGYKYIYYANSILEGLASSIGVSDSTKNQLIGEAKFIRAFCYFYIVNLFGDVPLITTIDYRINKLAFRTSSMKIYQQIISDLLDAKNILANDYAYSNGERIRPNKWVAIALLARTYLYSGDWVDAEMQSTAIINNSGVYKLVTDLNEVFLANSSEAIWQLMPVIPGQNTSEGVNFILTAAPTNIALSDQLLNSFESSDNRRTNWISSIAIDSNTYYFPSKYKVQASSTLIEYSMVLRLSEQYLIRAEARVLQNNISGAQADLNTIRHRAGLSDANAVTRSDLLTAILHERQVEFFSEWGHRWFDLKRTGNLNAVMGVVTPLKGGVWNSNWQFYPIPQNEIKNDPNLTQNNGYQ